MLNSWRMAYEMKILSAHRLPDMTADYARSARERGLEVIICGAGMAAHLAGAVIRSQEDARFFRTTHVKEQNYQKDVLVACHNIRQAYKALDVTQEQ